MRHCFRNVFYSNRTAGWSRRLRVVIGNVLLSQLDGDGGLDLAKGAENVGQLYLPRADNALGQLPPSARDRLAAKQKALVICHWLHFAVLVDLPLFAGFINFVK